MSLRFWHGLVCELLSHLPEFMGQLVYLNSHLVAFVLQLVNLVLGILESMILRCLLISRIVSSGMKLKHPCGQEDADEDKYDDGHDNCPVKALALNVHDLMFDFVASWNRHKVPR